MCDVTWASGYIREGRVSFSKRFNEIYFLTEPSLFISNHYPSNVSWTLLKDHPSLTQFLQAPFRPEGFIQNQVNQYAPHGGAIRVKTGEPFELRFTSNASEISPKATLRIIETKKTWTEWQTTCLLHQNERGEYVLIHRFDKRGYYQVYIWINGKATFVYNVTVG